MPNADDSGHATMPARLASFLRFAAFLLVNQLSLSVALVHGADSALIEDEKNSIDVYRRASPAVVYVTSTAVRRDIFSLNTQEIPRGSGSGFVWNKQGYIVTNYHVVRGADRLIITLADQSNWAAEVVGVAPEKDLVVLRIEAPQQVLHPLPFGDSDKLEVGRKVLAIGNPFGLDTTLTKGVVSALGREIEAVGNRKIRNVIQTDAAINPGNSGGPLLNSQGQLIGVNTAIYSPSGASAGIGFAIPVNTVKRYVPQLIRYGRINRPYLGVELASDRWARRYGISGVVVAEVSRGSPAEKAGIIGARRDRRGNIQLGDIIVEVDGRAVNTVDELLNILEQRETGDTITVVTRRNERPMRFRVRLRGSLTES